MSIDVSFSLPSVGAPRAHRGSVIPNIPGEHVGGGYRMRTEGTKSTGPVEMAFAILLYAGITAAGLAILWAQRHAGLMKTIFAIFLIGSFVAGTYKMVRVRMHQVWEKKSFGAAELIVHPWPIRLGDEITLLFFRAKRQRLPLEVIEASIECNEMYEEESDDSSQWQSRIRCTIRLETPPLPETGQPLRFEWTARIPDGVPASAMLTHSAIDWRLYVRLVAANEQVADTEFKLLVLPEMRI